LDLERGEFLETKIWISYYGYEETLHGFDKSARKLGVDQIDLLILHQALLSEIEQTRQAYRALETLLAEGRVRAIGVSNFMVDHLTGLLEQGDGGARGEPDRGAPLLHAARRAGLRCRPWEWHQRCMRVAAGVAAATGPRGGS
jgi:aryl-alcohol dehydrogenase-like predicted oxidoreductase